MSRKKITSLIICISLLIVLNVSLVFTTQINGYLYNVLENKFNIISADNNLRVHYISVGNGDAIAINLPDRKTVLIDTGTTKYANTYVNYIEQKVLPFDDDGKIDCLILSHADADHIGGTVHLLDSVEIKLTYVPWLDSSSDSKTYSNTMEAIENKTQSTKTGKDEVIDMGEYKISFLGPVNLGDTNNSCQLIKLEYMDKVFLFVGDIESDTESTYVSAYGDELDCDVLKVAHHGSNSSTSDTF